MQICASLNHRKKFKVEPSRLMSRKVTANLELLIIYLLNMYRFLHQMYPINT